MRLVHKRRGERPDLRAPRSFTRRSADRLKLVLDVSRLLAVPDLRTLLEQISDAAARVLDAERAIVTLTPPELADEPEGDEVLAASSVPDDPEALEAPLRDLDTQTIGFVEVFGKRTGPFTDEDRLLLDVFAEHAALAVQRYRLLQQAAQGHELRREMELARRVQAALLPRQMPDVPGLRAVGWTASASITGGDNYDVWKLPDGRLAVFLADASGHGLAAALVVLQVRSMLRALSEVCGEPEWLLSRVNARLMSDLEGGQFVTGFLGCLSPTGSLQWSSAGQGPIFIRPGADAAWEAHNAPSIPLGVAELSSEGAPVLHLRPGAVVVALTDGFFEARDAAGELFGPARVMSVLAASSDASPAGLVDALRDAVRAWSGREVPADDQTVVAVAYEG